MTESKPTITHDPVTWSILVDWYADQGDAEKEAEWRERADLARQILDTCRLAIKSKDYYNYRSVAKGPVEILFRFESKMPRIEASVRGRGELIAISRIDTFHLRRCWEDECPGSSSDHVLDFLRRILTAVKEASRGPA